MRCSTIRVIATASRAKNYETTGLHIFLRLLEDLRYKDIDDVNTDLDDDAVERMIRAWLSKYVISPSELYALLYRVKMLGDYDQALINSGIGPRAYVLAKDAIVEHAKDMLLSDQPWTPEEWNGAPEEWMADTRERMRTKFWEDLNENGEFWNRAAAFWNFDGRRLQAERDFVKKANEMYERVVGSYRLGPDRSLRTIIADHTFDIERVKAIEWITSPDRDMEGYDVRRPVDLTEQEAELIRNAVNQYFTDSYIELLAP